MHYCKCRNCGKVFAHKFTKHYSKSFHICIPCYEQNINLRSLWNRAKYV